MCISDEIRSMTEPDAVDLPREGNVEAQAGLEQHMLTMRMQICGIPGAEDHEPWMFGKPVCATERRMIRVGERRCVPLPPGGARSHHHCVGCCPEGAKPGEILHTTDAARRAIRTAELPVETEHERE